MIDLKRTPVWKRRQHKPNNSFFTEAIFFLRAGIVMLAVVYVIVHFGNFIDNF